MSLLGHFEFVNMSFGHKNAPSMFQRVMEEIFKDCIGICCEVYIDAIIIYSENEEESKRLL